MFTNIKMPARLAHKISIVFTIIIAFACIMSTTKAQGPDECIDGTKIPAYYKPYIGPLETTFKIGNF